MENPDKAINETSWSNIAFEAWKHHASIGGADKDRMITISTTLLGFSAVIVGFTLTNTHPKFMNVIFPSIIGIIIALISAAITIVYGGYANRNWSKADEIAKDRHWDIINSHNETIEPYRKSVLTFLALKYSKSTIYAKCLAPIFYVSLALACMSCLVHICIIIWFCITV